MSKLFSWKAKILGRKTPEPEKALCVTVPSDGSENVEANAAKQSRVRFEEQPAKERAWSNDFPGGPAKPGPPPKPEPPHVTTPFRGNGTYSPVEHTPYSPGPNGYPYGYSSHVNSVQQLGTIQEIERGIEQNGGSSKQQNNSSSVEQRAQEWKYADDVRVTIAPLAANEIDEPERPHRYQKESRASTVLQNLRDQKDHLDYAERRRRENMSPAQAMHHSIGPMNSHSLPAGQLPPTAAMNQSLHAGYRPMSPAYSSIATGRRSVEPQPQRRDFDEMNVVFLQFNDEVKRVILPPHIESIEQIKMAFVRTFPHLTRGFVDQPHVKIYIQEANRGQLFYELDDLRDIKNKAVLRLREQHLSGIASPTRFLDQPDYHSETEFDDGRNRFISLARPASAMAHAYDVKRGKSFDPFYDPYASASETESRAGSIARSGSVTPIIDREARIRMETMERQLAGLSSLVHTALTSKGMSESTQRDMAELRKEIFAMHPEHNDRAASEEPPSLPESLSSHTQQELHSLKQKVSQAGTDCRQLRRTAQVNAQTARSLIREAGEEITRIVANRMGNNGGKVEKVESVDEEKERQARDEHDQKIRGLLETLTAFEQNVETVRNSVLNANRKLRMSEVESLTEQLTHIGRNAAGIKTEFPSIQSKIEARIKADMERIVREEKYIRDETAAVDQSLRRCKALANIMVTMKKLAMVQDPGINRSSSRAQKQSDPSLPPPVPGPAHSSQPPSHSNGHSNGDVVPPPPVPPSPTGYQRAGGSNTNTLDNVLNEMNSNPPTVPHPPIGPVGQPPRPPSRTAVSDVRAKFKQPPELPEQIRSIMEDVRARVASPNPEATSTPVSERRANLEERQKELAEKQRQLRSQFQQLQTLTPLP